MTKDEILVKASEAAGIPKVQDENAVASAPPYYWSWYRDAFPGHNPDTGVEQDVPAGEKHQ